jgi:excisionase family DNA binding protein
MTQKTLTLTASQAAERLDVTAETVRAWARSGKIKVVRHPSGRMRFPAAAIEAIANGTQAAA